VQEAGELFFIQDINVFLYIKKTIDSKKKNRYPVFFLTEGGEARYYDSRLNSLRSSVHVASRCGCLGIVTESSPVIEAPRLVAKVRSSGLLLCTYGSKNNVVENARLQKAYGVDAIIVDKVRLVYSNIDEGTLSL
jgi:glycerophosphodiester phosphodiesterase